MIKNSTEHAEPLFIALMEIHVPFSNLFPWPKNHESEISLLQPKKTVRTDSAENNSNYPAPEAGNLIKGLSIGALLVIGCPPRRDLLRRPGNVHLLVNSYWRPLINTYSMNAYVV